MAGVEIGGHWQSICRRITSGGKLFRPATAPTGGCDALPRKNCTRTHRISWLTLILRAIAAVRIRLRRFRNITERLRGRLARIQGRGISIRRGRAEECCDREECPRNE